MNTKEAGIVREAVETLDAWTGRETEAVLTGTRAQREAALARRDEFYALARKLRPLAGTEGK